MDYIKKADQVIKKYSSGRNEYRGIYINSIGNEFILLPDIIDIPRIPVKELPFSQAVGFLEDAARFIPEFLSGHRMPSKRVPPSEQHFIHLLKRIEGRTVDFIHFFKVDLKFSGDPDGITRRGDTDHYPAYKTDRIYFKSRLVPVFRNSEKFLPVRLVDENRVESDQAFHTYAIFDEYDSSAVSVKLCEFAGRDSLTISPNLYPVIVYDYFTAALNIPEPCEQTLSLSAQLYEPLFHIIYEKTTGNPVPGSDPPETVFGEDLARSRGSLKFKKDSGRKLSSITAAYKLFRDEDMALSGIWRFDSLKKQKVETGSA